MYLLDTDAIVGFFREVPAAVSFIKSREHEQLFLSTLSLAELYKGAYQSVRKDVQLQRIDNLLLFMKLIPLNKKACALFGEQYALLSAKGKPTQEKDLLIASIALANGLMVVTRNTKHFENIPDLRIEQW